MSVYGRANGQLSPSMCVSGAFVRTCVRVRKKGKS